jgi:hypothetical protein
LITRAPLARTQLKVCIRLPDMQTHVAEAIENYVSGAANAGVVGNLQAVFYAERQRALEQWPFDGSAIGLKADS